MQSLQMASRGFVTLGQVWVDYKRIRTLKASTQCNYDRVINRCFDDWLNIEIRIISRDMIEQRHRELSSIHGKWGSGEALANLSMRILKALFTFAGFRYDELSALGNPVRRLSELRAWNKVPRRKRIVGSHDMKLWFDTLALLNNSVNRDLHLVLLFTGMRKNEAALLPWSGVDFKQRAILVTDTKNGDALELPISSHIHALLQNRRRLDLSGLYVFPGPRPDLPISKEARGYELVAKLSGIDFHFHDLRRTFATVADDLEIGIDVIKRLLNHRSNDVTRGYFCNGVERLRKPMQLINDEILRRAGRQNLAEFY